MKETKPGNSDKLTAEQIDEALDTLRQLICVALEVGRITLYRKYGIDRDGQGKPDDVEFSEQLKRARLNIGYSQQEVANLMGITKSTYCGYETGKRQPDIAKLKQLVRILKTTSGILLGI